MTRERLLFAGADEYQTVFAEAARDVAGIEFVAYAPDLDLTGIRYLLMWRPVPGLAKAMPNLQAVFCFGAGVERLLGSTEVPAHVPIVRMVEPGLTSGMVEYVLWQALRHHRRIWELEEAQAQGKWAPHWYPASWDRSVGILGFGELGQAAGEKLTEFGFPVRGWSRSRKEHAAIRCYAGADELAAFLDGLEILVCLLPLTPETKSILNADLLGRLKPGASLINVGRGGHLVEEDLIAALESGQLIAASLDVFSQEPLPATHAFWRHPRIFMTPHNASDTDPAGGLAAIARQIARAAQGHPLEHVADRARGY
ncbi:2-hydroxyacid dehydrogenase [Dongia rigui]|uniref:Glyoxylate/hydroxypyruvate reductase A n=1 Tax=Dongia rigui TaxID=940149 RepID=A0ABU5DXK6_9PROT|nr:glyoxylate/hydroxypyruvate reductase A [Dongia rigui]MDY0872051.1 glyoxylate/hydroxypyruvate reductase A [Dongia rigui]